MKLLTHFTMLLVTFAVLLAVASHDLPKILPTLTVLFVLGIVARIVWFYTR